MELKDKKCKPCEGGVKPMEEKEIQEKLKQLDGWAHQEEAIAKTFTFKNYDETLGFVNKVAEVAKSEDHHPNIEFGYKVCRVEYFTHAIGGISENDFICAAKVDQLQKAAH